jgi:hypothetical protein
MSQTSAQEEPWWDQFVQEYGVVPLRELARKYGTNSRRLRRAAQRSGLSDEPLVLRKNTALLGAIPDASVAEKLGVTREAVQGARARRRIDAYDNRASKKLGRRRAPKRSAEPAPRKPEAPKRRFRPDDAPPPVVVSRGPRSFSRSGTDRLGARKLDLPPVTPGLTERPRTSRRRRVVSPEGREGGDKKDGPAPAPVAVWRRSPTATKKGAPAPVRTLYDSKRDPSEEPPPVVSEVAEANPPSLKPKPAPSVPTAPVVEAPGVQAPVVEAPAPEAPVVQAPVVEAPVLETQASAPPAQVQRVHAQAYWRALVEVAGQSRELIIQAPSLADAAARAEAEGRVLAVGRAAVLGA